MARRQQLPAIGAVAARSQARDRGSRRGAKDGIRKYIRKTHPLMASLLERWQLEAFAFNTLDTTTQLSAFAELKLASCARPETRAGFLFDRHVRMA
jgi:hypothetical protein